MTPPHRALSVADPKAIVVSRARVLAAASAAIAAAVGIMVTGQGTPLLARVGAAAFLSIVAIVVVAARGGLVDLVVRWSLSLAATLAERRLRYFGPATPVAAEGLPFGVAMAYGVVAFSIWGIPWN